LLVQWVPHGYGYHSLNLPFCIWLWWRARRGDHVEIMLHEAFLRFFEGNWRQDAAALLHRVMTIVLLRAARRVWMSTPSWEKDWKPYALGRKIPFVWLPVPTTIPVHSASESGLELKARLVPPGSKLIGHFGTYGKNVAPMVERIAAKLLSGRIDLVLLLLGQSSETFREQLVRLNPRLAPQVVASGHLESEGISRHLQACDVLIQPFPEGASARRTSLIAGLAHGAPIVTTLGPMTEPFWETTDAVVSVPVEREDLFTLEIERLLGDPAEMVRLRKMSRRLYEAYFDTKHLVQMLRG
jgi:glycosyltransferase involved in cell wall biosynthesis